jgi:CRP-like cAMP-binding protein
MTVEPVFLKAIPLLRGFTTQELRDLAGMLELVRVEEDTLLIEQGTNRGGFYFILDGQVKVSRTLPGGREIVLARMGKGHVVGFLTMLDGRPCCPASSSKPSPPRPPPWACASSACWPGR